jgi:hypothetical protein
MKNIFNPSEQSELMQRLEKLTPQTKNLWGQMNVSQMLCHCTKAMQMPTGELKPKPEPIRFLGQFLKKAVLGEGPLKKNSPTAKELRATGQHEFDTEKQHFLSAFERLTKGGEGGAVAEKHPFFGKMKPNEWGRINYKHLDHHFSQFGV